MDGRKTRSRLSEALWTVGTAAALLTLLLVGLYLFGSLTRYHALVDDLRTVIQQQIEKQQPPVEEPP